MLILITGLPGTGKSAINAELRRRGYESYDGDEDKISRWLGDDGNPTDPSNVSDDFRKSHLKGISKSKMLELRQYAHDKTVFICNDPENDDDIWKLFDKVFALVLGEDTRLKRLLTRTNKNYGKELWQRQRDQVFVDKASHVYDERGYYQIDATLLVADITDKIIAQCNNLYDTHP